MRDERGPWYLVTGLILGAALGLLYAWLIAPRTYADTSPASLQAGFKDQYRAMVALAYLADENFPRAQARLKNLKDEDPIQALNEQAQRSLAEGASPREAQALGLLAVALGQGGPPASAASPTQALTETSTATENPQPSPTDSPTGPSPDPVTPTVPAGTTLSGETQTPAVTRTLGATGTPLATRTPTPTPGAPFVLKDQTFICDPDLIGPLLIVLAETTNGQPLPDVEAVVNWEGGEDHFFTGLKPELGLGYADFAMLPGVVYALRLAEGGQPISDLTPAECETSRGERYWGAWVLLFNRP
jgi:hypothetical protein